jgi:hypothetical protein
VSRAGQLILAVVLLLWQPLTFASTAGRALPSLGFRGWIAIVELIAAGLIAAVSVAAAWSLWSRTPHGVPMARLALILAAARSVQSLYWTRLPSDVIPGTQGLLATIILAHAALWLVFLSLPRRVRLTS